MSATQLRKAVAGAPHRPVLVFSQRTGWVVASWPREGAPHLRVRFSRRNVPEDEILAVRDLPPPPEGAR